MDRLSAIVDVHSHAILPYGHGAPVGAGNAQPDWSVDRALAYMDEHEIAACVLSVPDAANRASGPEARDIARQINDTLAQIVAEHPARFGALATLPARSADDAAAEVAYALDTLKLDGIATSTSIDDVYLGEPDFDPWFAEIDRRGATLFVHPTITEAGQRSLIGLNPSVIEFMFETTRMITNLVVTGAKQRFSNIKVISTHAGGTMPFLVNRLQLLEHLFGVGPGRLELSADEIREGVASFYYDLTAATSDAQLGALTELVPASQLLMGLDFPFMPESSFAPAMADLNRHAGFDTDARQSIAYGTAARLFPALRARIERE